METSTHCRVNFTKTAASMESAAYFALPMPVRQAERVSIPASVAAETEERRRREMSISASAEGKAG